MYNLAADMGGMGFIENNKALCMLSVLINTHLLQAAQEANVDRFFYAVSACVYNADKQTQRRRHAAEGSRRLSRRCPKMATAGRSCFSERMCRHFREDFGLVHARGALPQCLWPARHLGRRPRKSAGRDLPQSHRRRSKPATHEIEIWGDGKQTRSFMYIDDCVEGILKIMHSDIEEPINLGSDELTTINGLVEMVEDIAGVELKHRHNLSAPKGVNGRNSDNTLIKKYLGWAPGIRLRDGMERTYRWIYEEYLKVHRGEAVRT